MNTDSMAGCQVQTSPLVPVTVSGSSSGCTLQELGDSCSWCSLLGPLISPPQLIDTCLCKCVPLRSLTEIEASTNWTSIKPGKRMSPNRVEEVGNVEAHQ